MFAWTTANANRRCGAAGWALAPTASQEPCVEARATAAKWHRSAAPTVHAKPEPLDPHAQMGGAASMASSAIRLVRAKRASRGMNAQPPPIVATLHPSAIRTGIARMVVAEIPALPKRTAPSMHRNAFEMPVRPPARVTVAMDRRPVPSPLRSVRMTDGATTDRSGTRAPTTTNVPSFCVVARQTSANWGSRARPAVPPKIVGHRHRFATTHIAKTVDLVTTAKPLMIAAQMHPSAAPTVTVNAEARAMGVPQLLSVAGMRPFVAATGFARTEAPATDARALTIVTR